MTAPALPRPLAVALLILLACTFAANHIGARIAFDHGVGVIVAVLCRSGVTALALAAVLWWQREWPRLPAGTARWQLLLGALISLQSVCLYAAVARIPVALALLIFNTFPILLALLGWLLGGQRPTARMAALMALILFGLVLVLDLPTRLRQWGDTTPGWWSGVAFGFAAAAFFALALWVTERQLKPLRGTVRSFWTMAIAFAAMGAAAFSGAVPGALAWPVDAAGWGGLAALTVFYGSAFAVLFAWIPRLNMTENAPVMNVEPVATLVMAWLVLGQALASIQLLGGAVVLAGIVLLSLRRG